MAMAAFSIEPSQHAGVPVSVQRRQREGADREGRRDRKKEPCGTFAERFERHATVSCRVDDLVHAIEEAFSARCANLEVDRAIEE